MSEIEQVGRPSKVNEVDLDLLCSELEQGSTIKLACARVGISERTYSRWRLLGLQDEEPFIRCRLQQGDDRPQSCNVVVRKNLPR